MALVTCPDCQSQVSDAAPACPKCGRPQSPAPPRTPEPTTPATTTPPVGSSEPTWKKKGQMSPGAIALVVVLFLFGGIYGLAKVSAWLGPSPPHPTERADAEIEQARKARVEAAAKRRERLTAKRQDNYTRGVGLLAQGQPDKALEALGLVMEVDPAFADTAAQIEKAKEQIEQARAAEAERQKRLAEEQAKAAAAKKLEDYKWAKANLKTDSCGELERVVSILRAADSSEAPKLLKRALESQLRCEHRAGDLGMAIEIVKRNPVTLYVWIYNHGSSVRAANPNHFTLVTEDGRSHSYSTGSYEYQKPFGAIRAQPGTTADGVVVFDTRSAPRSLVYQDFHGRISRDFQ